MDEFDGNYDGLLPVVQGICRSLLLTKRIVVRGQENFVRSGRNIIIANHVGSYKDIAVLFRVVPRRIFFMANARIFSRASFQGMIRTHLLRHMGSFGTALDLALMPLKSWFVPTIAEDLRGGGEDPIRRFRDRLETRVRILFRDALRAAEIG